MKNHYGNNLNQFQQKLALLRKKRSLTQITKNSLKNLSPKNREKSIKENLNHKNRLKKNEF